jgi:CMP-N-acetylneuraminic acid synthetase
MKSMAIIPARSGSKRLPGKNLCKINDKTLLEYAIEASLSSAIFSDIIVTSNDPELLDLVATKFGDKVLYHLRPSSLSQDDSMLKTLLKYLIELYENESKNLDLVMALILPTSPLRTSEDIRSASALMKKNFENINGVMSVSRLRYPPQHSLLVDKDGFVQLMHPEYVDIQSQNLEPAYIHDGSIIIVKPKQFLKYGDFYMPGIIPFYIDENRAIDINTEFDLKLARYLMKEK